MQAQAATLKAHAVAQSAESSEKVAALQAQLEAMGTQLSNMGSLQGQVSELTSQLTHIKAKWKVEFEKRKKLHNQLIELKGAIRVLCRVRPLVAREAAAAGTTIPVNVLDEETIRVSSDKAIKEFEFDRVFAPSDGQDAVFEEVAMLVTSVLDGYNVCIMAYGQTGSGKTHTMEGPADNPGVNTRSLKVRARRWQSHSSPNPRHHAAAPSTCAYRLYLL